MLEDIHDLGLNNTLYLIVYHGTAHDLVDVSLGTLQRLCLN